MTQGSRIPRPVAGDGSCWAATAAAGGFVDASRKRQAEYIEPENMKAPSPELYRPNKVARLACC